jgi:PhzF family phenazine biosynthesis protein
MNLPIYQMDAFARRPFQGNPAAILPLEEWLPDATLQAIAAENNLAETGFYVREPSGYRIRWFTPTVEIDLCGHATLATAWLMTKRGEMTGSQVSFASRSGRLIVMRDGDRYVLDFPAHPPSSAESSVGLAKALGATPSAILASTFTLCVFEHEDQVRALAPDMAALTELGMAVIASARGSDCDFVSRMFAPSWGIPEDPVTGSSHTVLTPYWSRQLSKKEFFARQISKRGGELWCEDRGERIYIAGYVAPYLEGTITI